MTGKTALRLFVALTSLSAHAALESGNFEDNSNNTRSNILGAQINRGQGMMFLLDQWYTLGRPVTLNPVEVVAQDGSIVKGAANRPLVLDGGIDYLVVSEVNGLVTIAFNLEGQDDPQNPLPLEMTVRASELGMGQASVVALNEEDPYDDVTDGSSGEYEVAADDEEYDDTEVASTATDFSARRRRVYRSARGGGRSRQAVRRGRSGRGREARAGRSARRGGGGGGGRGFLRMGSRGGMTYCLGEVRINAKHVCGQVMPVIGKASIGYEAYKAKGWTPIDKGSNWSSYPKCTACFWGGGRQDCSGGSCGHTALKGDGNMWVGAGIRAVPRLPDQSGCKRRGRRVVCRKPYVFHGCVVAPGYGG